MGTLSPFARLLVEQRKRRGMSRSQLAEAAELSYPYISQLETGIRKPSRKAANELARALGVDVSELEGAIPGDAEDPLQLQRAEMFISERLSDSAGPSSLEPMAMAGPPAYSGSTEWTREDLIGQMLDLLEEFDSAERLDVLAEVQKRAMQRMLDARP